VRVADLPLGPVNVVILPRATAVSKGIMALAKTTASAIPRILLRFIFYPLSPAEMAKTFLSRGKAERPWSHSTI